MRARVKDSNNYGGAPAGSVLDLPESEIDAHPWCLEKLGDPEPEAKPAKKKPK